MREEDHPPTLPPDAKHERGRARERRKWRRVVLHSHRTRNANQGDANEGGRDYAPIRPETRTREEGPTLPSDPKYEREGESMSPSNAKCKSECRWCPLCPQQWQSANESCWPPLLPTCICLDTLTTLALSANHQLLPFPPACAPLHQPPFPS